MLFLDDETDLNWPNLLFGIFVNSMNCRTCVRPKNVIGQLIFANKKDDECSRCYQFVALSCKFDAELQGNVDSGFPFRFNNKKSANFFFFKSHRLSSKLDWLTLQFSYEQNMASECLCQSSSAKWSILNWEWFINVFDNSLNAMSNTKVVIHNSAKYTLSLMIQFTTKYLEFLIKWFWWLIFNNWTF